MPRAWLSRKDPHHLRNGLLRFSGFTTVELLVFVAALVIVASVALPSWQTQQERKQLRESGEQLAAFLAETRMEAVMRSQVTSISWQRQDDQEWCLGASTGEHGCDCTRRQVSADASCSIDGRIAVFTNNDLRYPGILESIRGDGSLSFNPANGKLLEPSDEIDMLFISDRGRFSLNVQLDGEGQVRLCSDHSNTRLPGYRLC